LVLRVLFVEDDRTIREATRIGLERDGFVVEVAGDGSEGWAAFRRSPPDVALLDIMLPGVDGISLCRKIREHSTVPIVMLTARGDPVDIVLGLEVGADDYVVKPFDLPVLSARLRAVLRRGAHVPRGDVRQLGDLEIDPRGAVVKRDGALVSLTPTEYRLLLDLAEHAGVVRSRDDLLQSVWGYDWSGDARLVDVHVQRLRAKVGAGAIETVRGFGYKLPRR
jgi:DNA-binding response OmpR family regulator